MAMSDERVDTTIDEVVRELTAGEPGRAFTARVLARIDAGETAQRTRGTWRAAWVLSPPALGAAIALAVAVFHTGSTTPVRQPPATAGRGNNESNAATEVGAALTDSPRVTFRLPTRTLAAASRSDGPRGSEIDALALTPLDVVPISVSELEPLDSIHLQELHTIEPIAVTPLGDDHEGDRP